MEGNQIKVFGIPYAGGSASIYYHWREMLGPAIQFIPVEMAGHGKRMGEPLYQSFAEAVDDLELQITKQLDGSSFALFGHSLGARLAFEVSRVLSQKGQSPCHLFVSGSSAPHRTRPKQMIHDLDDELLIKELVKMGGTPESLLDHPALAELFLPIIRADFAISESYQLMEPDAVLSCPISVWYGDQEIGEEEDILSWSRYTNECFSIHSFSGGHFFIQDKANEPEIYRVLGSSLKLPN
ncbi:thioesterase II family protein [Ammoniphilus sp. CFH 90114]|uniref:thioesterase II family protein n=1 Tax=Ammoniphilus sp. CFH 90114 TaxID=2493665 RepID=UPI0013E90868|nr:thioesterase [Ammoniphilus sp. CFH 90114]